MRRAARVRWRAPATRRDVAAGCRAKLLLRNCVLQCGTHTGVRRCVASPRRACWSTLATVCWGVPRGKRPKALAQLATSCSSQQEPSRRSTGRADHQIEGLTVCTSSGGPTTDKAPLLQQLASQSPGAARVRHGRAVLVSC